ncbi:hypothetical protein J1614_008580 [Plenodomus biglobosus]|nr:hypothetical protein J1614_008580 [Plenodomus biglobosus]
MNKAKTQPGSASVPVSRLVSSAGVRQAPHPSNPIHHAMARLLLHSQQLARLLAARRLVQKKATGMAGQMALIIKAVA